MGVVYNEKEAAEGARRWECRGGAGGQWRIYKFVYPKVKLDSWFLLYPSLVQSPRRRGRLNITLTFKLTERLPCS
jgi:hypothetical protein